MRASMRNLAVLYIEFKSQMEQADKVCQSAEDLFDRGNFQELRDAMFNVCLKEDNS